LSAIVLDASAAVEIAFQTPVGRQLQAKIPTGSTTWVPEHYFVEVTAVLRRAEINGRHTKAQVCVALDRLLSAPVRRVSVRPLISEAWLLRHNMTVADSIYVVMARQPGSGSGDDGFEARAQPYPSGRNDHTLTEGGALTCFGSEHLFGTRSVQTARGDAGTLRRRWRPWRRSGPAVNQSVFISYARSASSQAAGMLSAQSEP